MTLGERNGDCWHWKDYSGGAYSLLLTLDDGSSRCDFCEKILDKEEQTKVDQEIEQYLFGRNND